MMFKNLLVPLTCVANKGLLLKFSASTICTKTSLDNEDKGITIVSLDYPKNKNALNKESVQSLSNAFEEISTDSNTRVVILRSLVPRVFCAGADLKERLTLSDSEIKSFLNKLNELMFKVEECPVPVISSIDGAALGGGLELALASDIRIASEVAKIGLLETKLAILPGAGGTQRLTRLVGSSLAKELIFTARVLNGIQAKELGIVNHVTKDPETAFQKAIEIAREILPNGPLGVKYAKLAINKGKEVDIYQGCAIEGLCYSQVIPTKDRLEGLKAFVEKRKPDYKGV
ncbi:methylglutaconyl-CoA hydratase, mitochondrial [Halyomorpha halys]|uniref:methylglutaconyl-CoA hydratase, mitochondrial n=1 Tax=Halyomorpha halys TaxID=286706 RepID=UPI0006D4E646|nr:methylglutaconyl-CoA hydratase, mitochondrial [Halyomorpha halys]